VEGLPVIHDYRPARADRDLLVHRARFLARLGLAWHGIEAAVAIGAGVLASSIALVGFGADSLAEMVAGSVVLWRFGSWRSASDAAERRAQKCLISGFQLAPSSSWSG